MIYDVKQWGALEGLRGSSELTSAWRALVPSLSRVHGQLIQACGRMLSGGF